MLTASQVHPDAPLSLRPIFDRYSCRTFRGDPIPDEHLYWLKEVLRWAPSAGNTQPWHYFVISDDHIKRALADAAYGQKFIAKSPVVFVICSHPARSSQLYGERGAALYHLQDTAAAVENLLIAATALGYGACWIGAFSEFQVEQILNLDSALRPVAMVPVGLSARPHKKRTSRRQASELFTSIP